MTRFSEHSPDIPPEPQPKRWYDADPALSRALMSLRSAPDKYQAQIALNIIKIVIEHQMEHDSTMSAALRERLARHALNEEMDLPKLDPAYRRRWYDVNQTLSSAMQLLRDCPDDLQRNVIPTISRMIEQTLAEQI